MTKFNKQWKMFQTCLKKIFIYIIYNYIQAYSTEDKKAVNARKRAAKKEADEAEQVIYSFLRLFPTLPTHDTASRGMFSYKLFLVNEYPAKFS